MAKETKSNALRARKGEMGRKLATGAKNLDNFRPKGKKSYEVLDKITREYKGDDK